MERSLLFTVCPGLHVVNLLNDRHDFCYDFVGGFSVLEILIHNQRQ